MVSHSQKKWGRRLADGRHLGQSERKIGVEYGLLDKARKRSTLFMLASVGCRLIASLHGDLWPR